MKLEILSVLRVLLLLTGSSQAVGHGSAAASTTVALRRDDGGQGSADLTSDPAQTVHQQICNTTTSTATKETTPTTSVMSEKSRSDLLTTSSTEDLPAPTSAGPLLHTSTVVTGELLTSTITSPKPVLTSTPVHSTPSTTTTGRHLSPAGPTHMELPSQLKVGDEDYEAHRSRSALDPLLAALLSIFIITTAVVFVVLFLKFRQRTNHPEFQRLQDLPMDDLMEDTPLSRYSY